MAAVRTEGAVLAETFNHYWTGDEGKRRNCLQSAQCFPWFNAVLR